MKHQLVNWFPFWKSFHFIRFKKPAYGCYAWSIHLVYFEIRKWVVERPK